MPTRGPGDCAVAGEGPGPGQPADRRCRGRRPPTRQAGCRGARRSAIDLLVIEQPDLPLLPALRSPWPTAVVDPDQALALVAGHPTWTAVTRGGDLLAPAGPPAAAGGRPRCRSRPNATNPIPNWPRWPRDRRAGGRAGPGRGERRARRADADRALSALHDSDAQLAAVTEQLGRLAAASRSAAEADRLDRQRSAEVQSAIGRHRQVADAGGPAVGGRGRRQRRGGHHRAGRDGRRAAPAQHQELDARLALRTAEERAAQPPATRIAAPRRARRSAQLRARAAAVRRAAAQLAAAVSGPRISAPGRLAARCGRWRRRRRTPPRSGCRCRPHADRGPHPSRRLQQEWDALTDAVHSGEVLRAQQRVRRAAVRPGGARNSP